MSILLEPPTEIGLDDLSLQDRTVVLQAIGQRWDSLVADFLAWDRVNPALLEQFLSNMALPYVHQTVRRDILTDLLRTLADQTRALDDYRTLGTIPGTLDDPEAYGNASPEVLVALMETDIDRTLFALLHGPDAMPCRRCERNAYVWRWNPARWPTSAYCAPCWEAQQ
jgi:hypothetical protein